MFQLWWVVGAIIEALRDGGLETGVSVKRLLGLADREILQLYTQGEGALFAEPAGRAAQQSALLHRPRHQQRSQGHGGARLVPAERTAERRRFGRAGTRESLRAVGEADAHGVGGHPRGPGQGQRRARHLRPARRPARRARIAGRHAAQDRRHARRAGPRRTAPARASKKPPASKPWPRARPPRITPRWCTSPPRSSTSKIASTAISSGSSFPRRRTPQEDAGSVDVDFQQVQSAVLRECSVNLVRVKEAIASNVAGTLDVGALDAWPGLIAGIKAGPAHARQDPRRRHRRRHREESEGTAAARWHGRSA